jgi:hypothetical protein
MHRREVVGLNARKYMYRRCESYSQRGLQHDSSALSILQDNKHLQPYPSPTAEQTSLQSNDGDTATEGVYISGGSLISHAPPLNCASITPFLKFRHGRTTFGYLSLRVRSL